MTEFFRNDAFLIVTIIAAAIILFYGLYRVITKKKGSWSKKLGAAPVDAELSLAGESRGEARARAFLENYFGRPFVRARPDFLNNPVTGYNLEIDCYNADLKLGVEVHGRQHYEYVPFFHSSKEVFRNQQYRDVLKRIYAERAGILLIELPYTEERNLEAYLQKQLEENFFPEE